MNRYGLLTVLVFAALFSCEAQASDLEQCADQFVGGTTSNAPAILGSAPGTPFGTNEHLCYGVPEQSFFAIEYWPEVFAPRWVAYRLAPENYGSDGCSTFTRNRGNCYFRMHSWDDFESCTSASDPFHSDLMLPHPKLAIGDFENTGHDRGHLKPRQSASWHVCATHQTFSMANMSAQAAAFNQGIWADLEQQVLTWAFDGGPVYVVTGAIYRKFPHERFAVFSDGALSAAEIYEPGLTLLAATERIRTNFDDYDPGDILRPQRSANPDRVSQRTRNMPLPTGFFKVVYRPAQDGEPARSIAFMLPHSFENLRLLAASYPGMPSASTYWAFVSRIDLIEEASGITFPWLTREEKRSWGDGWFFARPTGRNVSQGCQGGIPAGVIEASTLPERLSACSTVP